MRGVKRIILGDGNEEDDFFGPVISYYGREQAMGDGVIHDITDTAKEAGWGIPAAITNGLEIVLKNIPKGSWQDYAGRLWDVVSVGAMHARSGKIKGNQHVYQLQIHQPERQTLLKIKMTLEGDDNGDPAVTFSLEFED